MINDELARKVTLEAIGSYDSFRCAREGGLYIIEERDQVVEICLPMIPGTVKSIISLPEQSRIDYRDLYQAAAWGLVEAVDSFEPRKIVLHNKRPRPIKISTHAWWRIRKRVLEEVQDTHWVIARPPRSATESFMKDQMTDAERELYVFTVLAPFESHIDTWGAPSDRATIRASLGHEYAHGLSGDRNG